MRVSNISLDQPEVKLWFEALYNTYAKKHKRALEKYDEPEARCCLGHLCHALHVKRDVDEINGIVKYKDKGKDSWEISILPKEVAILLDITMDGSFIRPISIKGVLHGNLVRVNDRTDLSLPAIAEIIKTQIIHKNFMACYYG